MIAILRLFFFLHIEKNHRWKMIEIGQSITIYVWSNTEWYFCWKEDGPYLKSYIYNVILLKQAWIMKKVVNISYLLAIVSYMTYISTSNILHSTSNILHAIILKLLLNCSINWDEILHPFFHLHKCGQVAHPRCPYVKYERCPGCFVYIYRKIKLLMIMNYNVYMLWINKRFFSKIMFLIEYM